MELQRRATVVTGATGFLGRELVAALLRNPGERIVTPLRPSHGAHAAERLHRLLKAVEPESERRTEALRKAAVAIQIWRSYKGGKVFLLRFALAGGVFIASAIGLGLAVLGVPGALLAALAGLGELAALAGLTVLLGGALFVLSAVAAFLGLAASVTAAVFLVTRLVVVAFSTGMVFPPAKPDQRSCCGLLGDDEDKLAVVLMSTEQRATIANASDAIHTAIAMPDCVFN